MGASLDRDLSFPRPPGCGDPLQLPPNASSKASCPHDAEYEQIAQGRIPSIQIARFDRVWRQLDWIPESMRTAV